MIGMNKLPIAGVAPRAGARIETVFSTGGNYNPAGVAPRAGARIETPFKTSRLTSGIRSPPARGRGSKHFPGRVHRQSAGGVAPRAGARIET